MIPPYGARYGPMMPMEDYYDQMIASPMGANRMMGPMGGSAYGGTQYAQAMSSLMSYINDKDNFQPQGCGWDGVRNRCTDGLNICKGGCRDFSNDITHDCRCIPFGYMALMSLGRK
ncbi:unnamed protein product [Bursaphelenchus xylophilus]|uniref:(pine wood nematode) hypothetical protein n=1 Tax=Bursaphelenchus xylophilus TaxID=6326 RepID=A0A1I7RTJ4_BURXY|nr:unnamed protein product [Bursaphelenchus xylophilus]CAG9122397.1 unnamed protein product [Bursaphelenchus xylophilus]